MNRLLAASSLALSIAMPRPLLAQDAAEDFTELREDVWQWTLDNAPWLATNLGDPRGDGKLGDPSMEGYDRWVSETRDYLARLEAIDDDGAAGRPCYRLCADGARFPRHAGGG
jgi:uncharacterized protein (DUF885 family)